MKSRSFFSIYQKTGTMVKKTFLATSVENVAQNIRNIINLIRSYRCTCPSNWS